LLTLFDFGLLPFYLSFIIVVYLSIQRRREKDNPAYKYFVKGLIAKITGGILLCIVYTKYYNGGDTTAYHESSVYLYNLFFKHPDIWLKIMLNDLRWENYYYFDGYTGYPGFYRDAQSFTVVRLTCLFQFFSFNSYLITTVLLATFCYQGIWRLYLVFCELYPTIHRAFFFSILLVPSVVFWGSGVLKDSYTLTAGCWFTYSFFRIFIRPKRLLLNIITAFLSGWLLMQIKPYILLALLPGAFIWLTLHYTRQIESVSAKVILTPLLAGVVFLGGYFTISSIQSNLQQYSSIEKVIEKASVTQQDLKQDYYQGNSFDIGRFDNSISGILSKFPSAFTAGLFRPFIWEARNPVMLIAGLENAFMLGLTFFIFFRIGLLAFFRAVISNPLIFFSLVFSIFFSFFVGLTTANFGALVRYKIPALPFYFSSILIVYNLYVKKSVDKTQVTERVPLAGDASIA